MNDPNQAYRTSWRGHQCSPIRTTQHCFAVGDDIHTITIESWTVTQYREEVWVDGVKRVHCLGFLERFEPESPLTDEEWARSECRVSDEVLSITHWAEANVQLPGHDEPTRFNGIRHEKVHLDGTQRPDDLMGDIYHAIGDVIDAVMTELADPTPPVGEPIWMDDRLRAEIEAEGARIVDVRFLDGSTRPVSVVKGETGGYAVRLHQIYRPNHRTRTSHWEAGHGDHFMTAVYDLIHRRDREERKANPKGIDAVPAGAQLDYDTAFCMQTHHSHLTVWNDLKLMTEEGTGRQACWVQPKGGTAWRIFAPSTDMADAMVVFEELAHEIHGGAHLAFDGDCFEPPPWMCSSGSWHGSSLGFGETAQLAICRCFVRSVHHGKLDATLNDGLDQPVDPFAQPTNDRVD